MIYPAYVECIRSPNTFIAGIKGKTANINSWTTRLVTINGLSPESRFDLRKLIPDGTHITLTRRLSAGDDVDQWCCDVAIGDGEDLVETIAEREGDGR